MSDIAAMYTITVYKRFESGALAGLTIACSFSVQDQESKAMNVRQLNAVLGMEQRDAFTQRPYVVVGFDVQNIADLEGMTMFEIQTKTEYGTWIADGVGNTNNEFPTEQEAWDAIEQLRTLGDEWKDAEYRVVPVPE